MIFNDIDKDGYPAAWRAASERIRRGGLYVCDNVLWYGRVAVEDPDDTRPRYTEAVLEHNRLVARGRALPLDDRPHPRRRDGGHPDRLSTPRPGFEADGPTIGWRPVSTETNRKGQFGPLYKGHEGQYSWLLHRITGVAIILFLFAHVVDTAVVGWGPDAYNRVASVYHNPFVRLLELGLVAAVLYHSFNGVKIMLIDFFPGLTRHIRASGSPPPSCSSAR